MAYRTMEPVNPAEAQLRSLAQSWDHPGSKTMIYPPNKARVERAQRETGSWATMEPAGVASGPSGLSRFGYRGLGGMDSVPQWAWWAGGGLLAGLVAGWLFVK